MRATPTAVTAPAELDLRDELARAHPRAHAWAVRCCQGDRAEAEDVLHESYMKVLDGRARYDRRSTFGTWLLGVVRRTAHEHRRRHWLRVVRLDRWWRATAGDDAPAAADAPADDELAALRAALPRLSKRQQEVLHLVFYQNLTIQDAAEVLAMPVGTARTHYERGKARLRALLGHGDA